MKKTFWDKRIPSLLGLLFLAISVGMISWFGKNYTQLRSKASVGETPVAMQISNITDTSFTVSYTTTDRVTGLISYGRDDKLGQVALDDRDGGEAGKPSARQVHYITVSRLDPATKYYFSIRSGALEFLNNNKPYEVATAASLSESNPTQFSVKGSINLPDGTIPMDGVVYLTASASQSLSTPVKGDGTYLLSLASLRTSDLASYVKLESDTILQLIILSAAGSQSKVSVRLVHANPVPVITLSKDYDFTIDTSFTDFTASGSAAASPSGTLTPAAPSSGFPSVPVEVANKLDITTPKEAEKFIDQQPVFNGTTFPDTSVYIIVTTIGSTDELRTSVKADNFGYWQFRPTTRLSPGEHAINVRSLDSTGKEYKIQRSFTVFADGSQFTEPSVSPTVGPSPTASASPVPTSTPTPTPLPTVTPTTAPTFIPTPTLLQTITPVISPTSRPTSLPIKPPGSSSLLLGGFLAVLSLSAGFMLFFLL